MAQLSKLAQGHLDLPSARSQLDLDWLADQVATLGGIGSTIESIKKANSALEVFELAESHNLPLADRIADKARITALNVLSGAPVAVEILVFNRQGQLVGMAHGW